MSAESTDYLIMGAGAVGLAFADTILTETNAHVTVVDRYAQPGGHWTKSYPFVRLHQPSAYYGVRSRQLGNGSKERNGLNTGLQMGASAVQIVGYFEELIAEQLLPTGRFSYLPFTDYIGEHRVRSLVSGQTTRFDVRQRFVDATYSGTKLPDTHTPTYSVEPGIALVTPTKLLDALAARDETPRRYVVIGGGKTGVDVALWLLESGVLPAQITWVIPRDSWFNDRETAQPGIEFFDDMIGTHAARMEAFAGSSNIAELFTSMERTGRMLRLDPSVEPKMFHFATISRDELTCLRQISHVVRFGRVVSITEDGLTLERGTAGIHGDALYVDCSASGITRRPTRPIFEPGRITPQLVRAPFVGLSVSAIAYVEAHFKDDGEKNALCCPLSYPDRPEDYVTTMLINLRNEHAWSLQPELKQWLRQNRLDPSSSTLAQVDPKDAAKLETLARIKEAAAPAAMNLKRLASQINDPEKSASKAVMGWPREKTGVP